MGNHKFRLSDMLPNAWFYKLRDMSKTKNNHNNKKSPSSTMQKKPHFSQPRSSFYYAAESIRVDKFYNNSPANLSYSYFADQPRRSSSSKRSRSKRKTIYYKPSPNLIIPSSASIDDSSSEEDNNSQSFNGLASCSSSCTCQFSSSTADIIIDMNERVDDTLSEVDLPPILTNTNNNRHSDIPRAGSEEGEMYADLPPILTKPAKTNASGSFPIKITKEESTKAPRKSISQSRGVKLRANSPKIKGHGRKSVSKRKSFSAGSFAMVKASLDPQKDFRESMMEMIVENNIKASKDLEDLLACYLSLNSEEYHHLIIKAFEQIWFNFPHLHF